MLIHKGQSNNQMRIVFTVERNDEDNQIGYQTYLSNGCLLVLLQFYNSYSSLFWTVQMDDYKCLMQLSDEEFLKTLNNQLGRFAPRIKNLSNKRMIFPLESLQAQRYTKKNGPNEEDVFNINYIINNVQLYGNE